MQASDSIICLFEGMRDAPFYKIGQTSQTRLDLRKQELEKSLGSQLKLRAWFPSGPFHKKIQLFSQIFKGWDLPVKWPGGRPRDIYRMQPAFVNLFFQA